jgi:hypothetical protein
VCSGFRRFPNDETKLGGEISERVVSDLDEPDVGHSLFGACEDCSLEFPPNLVVLRFDRDRSSGVDRRSFVEEVASDDAAVMLGDDTKGPGLPRVGAHAAVAASTDGKSWGKPCWSAIAANASWLTRPLCSASAK